MEDRQSGLMWWADDSKQTSRKGISASCNAYKLAPCLQRWSHTAKSGSV